MVYAELGISNRHRDVHSVPYDRNRHRSGILAVRSRNGRLPALFSRDESIFVHRQDIRITALPDNLSFPVSQPFSRPSNQVLFRLFGFSTVLRIAAVF